jgi:lipopolysaccharide assembly protein A
MWLLKAALFFTLFAFALNNQNVVAVHFFFGQQWQAPLVLVVLAAFVAGMALGVMFMVPRWWRSRQAARKSSTASPAATSPTASDSAGPPHGI